MKGSAIIAVFILIVIGAVVIGGYLSYITGEANMTKQLNDSIKALYIAEAGLERKIYEIYQGDFDDIDEVPFPLPVLNPDITYEVDLDDDDDDDDDIDDDDDPDDDVDSSGTIFRVTSTGRYNQEERVVRQDISVVNLWDIAVFGGAGSAGQISGNTQIRGTLYVLGEESFIDINGDNLYDAGVDTLIDDNGNGTRDNLSPTDYAINGSGSFYVGNNYDKVGGGNALPAEFGSRIPSIGAGTLNAEVNVKYGKVGLGGSAQIGKSDVPMDLVNVPDGFDPADAPDPGAGQKVFSDKVLYDRDRFNEKFRLPSLYDVVGGSTRLQTLQNDGLVVTVGVDIPETITPDSVINLSDGTNSFSMDGSGNMTINGIIYIDGNGNNLTFDKATGGGPPRDTIYYTGKGSIVFANGIPDGELLTVNTNIYTQAVGGSAYPENNIIGFMTPNNIEFNVSQLEVMAIFYAGDTITSQMQTSVAGAFLSKNFNMSTNVPEVFQVKNVKDNLPPGMINIPPVVVVESWREVF